MRLRSCEHYVGGFVWKIKKGDLVKLKLYLPGLEKKGREDDYEYTNGVVISEIKYDSDEQLLMWPFVDVYVFKTDTIESCIAGSIEIISNS